MPRGTPLIKELAQDYELLNEQIKEQGFIEAKLNGLIDQRERQLTTLIAAEDKSLKLTREKVDSLKEAPEEAVKFGNALRNTFPTFIGILESIKDVKDTIDDLGLGGFAKFGAVAFAVGKAFDFIATSVTETRKELGVTANEAASIAIQQKLIAFQGKLFGLESEDISQASLAIRENLGVSAQEATSLSLSFARTAAATTPFWAINPTPTALSIRNTIKPATAPPIPSQRCERTSVCHMPWFSGSSSSPGCWSWGLTTMTCS